MFAAARSVSRRGWSGILWGMIISTVVLLFHATLAINSLAHVWGTASLDDGHLAQQSAPRVIVTLGEGWHNNHHHFSSARQGFFWWEIDLSYYARASCPRPPRGSSGISASRRRRPGAGTLKRRKN